MVGVISVDFHVFTRHLSLTTGIAKFTCDAYKLTANKQLIKFPKLSCPGTSPLLVYTLYFQLIEGSLQTFVIKCLFHCMLDMVSFFVGPIQHMIHRSV